MAIGEFCSRDVVIADELIDEGLNEHGYTWERVPSREV